MSAVPEKLGAAIYVIAGNKIRIRRTDLLRIDNR
jgi:hypothetical protein